MDAVELAALIRVSGDTLHIPCRVQPRSSRNAIVGVYDNALKIALTAPPVEGKANSELIAFLARLLHIPKNDIHLESGESSKRKILAIKKLSSEKFINIICS